MHCSDNHNIKFYALTIHAHVGTIEDATGMLQVDFANQYVGGGVLSGVCQQY